MMWEVVVVVVVILVIKLIIGGPASSGSSITPDAGSTMEILKKTTVAKRDRSSKAFSEVLEDCDIILIYFSAHWCPPCRMFTPILADVYSQLKKQHKKVEVIFVSSDRDEASMYQYMEESHGDWFTVTFNDSARSELGKHFSVRGIPTLIVLGKDGTVISTDGRSAVQNNGAAAWDTWNI
ncbi:putative nucleoredoxin 3-like [Tropilaelaps mercedesae]|uniref:protein-disulfide reductase n=1 Tax=Tropilaelaps mercedesae TaxID=418985 RepID=A0A1V9XU73_9ACAR|nr:putative nucleoredoxin 3-like [Tropilaelaps mercedesae]